MVIVGTRWDLNLCFRLLSIETEEPVKQLPISEMNKKKGSLENLMFDESPDEHPQGFSIILAHIVSLFFNLFFVMSADDNNQKLLEDIFGTAAELHHRKKTEMPRKIMSNVRLLIAYNNIGISAAQHELLSGMDDSMKNDMQLLNDILSDSHPVSTDGFWDAFAGDGQNFMYPLAHSANDLF